MNDLLKKNCLAIVPYNERDTVVLNPCNILEKRSGKKQLLVHYILNALFTRPTVALDDLKNNAQCLLRFDKACKTDLKSCYWQYPLTEESSRQLSFEFGGVVYRPLALPYGASMNVFIVQSINRIPCEYIKHKFDLTGFLYIDDYAFESRAVPAEKVEHYGIHELDSFPMKSMLESLGYYLSADKTEIDKSIFEFIGYDINLTAKTLGIKQATIQKLHEKLAENTVQVGPHQFIEISALESILGSLNFIGSCSELGLTKILHLQLNFISAQKDNKKHVWINEHMEKELTYWKNFLPGTSVAITSFSTRHCNLFTSGEQPEKCASDASSTKYGWKIFGDNQIMTSGAGDFGPSLIKKLSALEFSLSVDWENQAIYVKEFLAFYLMIEMLPRRSTYLGWCDNQIVCANFQKTRSNNPVTNEILIRIFKLLSEREIHLKIVWVPTKVMLHGGADDISRNDYGCFNRIIRISNLGWEFIKKKFPQKYHLVFGYILDAHENDGITYSSFHQEELEDQFVNMDPFQHMYQAYDNNKLTGTQVIMPPVNVLQKTIQTIENFKHQNSCIFLLIIPKSQLFFAKMRLKHKLNFEYFKFQASNKGKFSKLTIRTREDHYAIRFGSDLK